MLSPMAESKTVLEWYEHQDFRSFGTCGCICGCCRRLVLGKALWVAPGTFQRQPFQNHKAPGLRNS